jgi:hypothetical protein
MNICLTLQICRFLNGSDYFRSRIPVRYGNWGHKNSYSPWGVEFDQSTVQPRHYHRDGFYQENIADSPPGRYYVIITMMDSVRKTEQLVRLVCITSELPWWILSEFSVQFGI